MAATKKAPVKKAQIYALTDPRTEQVRYIGKAGNAEARLKQHLKERRGYPKDCWIKSLIGDGCSPGVFVIEEVLEGDWVEAEIFWIAYFKSIGANLLNLAEGGNQPYCSKEVRAENGRVAAIKRQSTPRSRKIWQLKRMLGQSLQQGYATESTKAKLRGLAKSHPDMFGMWASV